MTFDLHAALPNLIPRAIAWAEQCSAAILRDGRPLDAAQSGLAARAGVSDPSAIRLLEVPHLAPPEDSGLKHAFFATGLLGANMAGLTLGYGVYICAGASSPKLLSHQFRHVYQFEQAGSLPAFLHEYIAQLIAFGHDNAPMEIDARRYEVLRA